MAHIIKIKKACYRNHLYKLNEKETFFQIIYMDLSNIFLLTIDSYKNLYNIQMNFNIVHIYYII
jgi:hypothetical protein